MPLSPGTRIADRYIVGARLGGGGMADVYAATDSRLDAPVALKVLRVAIHSVAERLALEGRIQAQLRHPHIVAVTDLITVDGAPGLVMERVNGPSLAGLLAEVTLSPDEALSIAHGILAGVRAAHDRGLVHRDLKPANVLVARIGDRLVPKVADFGLARLLDSDGQGTRTGAAMGTPRYMAPEQIRSAAEVDHRADLFSLGALLYELLEGRAAFEGEDTLELFNAVCGGAHRPFQRLRALPEGVQQAVAGCLSVDPADRPADVAAVQDLLGPRPDVAFRAEALEAHSRGSRVGPADSTQGDLIGSGARGDTWQPQVFDGVQMDETPPMTAATWAPDLPASGAPASGAPASGPPASGPPASGAPASGAPAGGAVGGRGAATGPAPVGPRPTRRAPLLTGLVLLVAMIIAGGVALKRDNQPVAFAADVAPQARDPDHQDLLDQAWAEYEANEDLDAIRHLDQLLEGGADDPSVHLLRAAVALGFDGWSVFTRQIEAGAASLRGEVGPVPDLLTALDQGLRQDSTLSWWSPTFAAHTAKHPDDWLAWVMWAVGMVAAPGQVPFDDAVVEQILARNPDAVGAWVVAVDLRRAFGDAAGARAAGEEGLSRHPGSAALRGSVARVLLEAGDVDAALEQALDCLRRDPQWTPCRTTGAGIAIQKGDDQTLEGLLAPILAPEADPALAYQVRHGVAQALEGHGRPDAAADHWAGAVRAARAADQPGAAVDILAARTRFAWSPLRASDATLEARLRELDAALADPELPRHARQGPGRDSQVSHALLALRRGDPAPATALLAEVEGDRADVLRTALLVNAPTMGSPDDLPATCGLLAWAVWAAAWPDQQDVLTRRADAACRDALSADQGLWRSVALDAAPTSVAWARPERGLPVWDRRR